MTEIVPTPRFAAVEQAVRAGAAASGVDFSLLIATARRESSLNPTARAGTSSASGLFQFIESTWLDMVRRHGAAHGMGEAAAQIEMRGGRPFVADPAARQRILDLRFDPELATRMAGELAKENAAHLSSRLGRAPSAGELYAAHVLGPAGAVRLIRAAAAGEGDASALFPREAGANRHLFFTRDGSARSASELLARLDLTSVAAPNPVPAASAEPVAPAPAAPRGPGLMAADTADALIAMLAAPSHDGLMRLLRDEPDDRDDA